MAVWWLFSIPVAVVAFPLMLFVCISRKNRQGTLDVANANKGSPDKDVALKGIRPTGSQYRSTNVTDLDNSLGNHQSNGNGREVNGSHRDSVVTVDMNEEPPPSPLTVFQFPTSPDQSLANSLVAPPSFEEDNQDNVTGLDATASYREPATMGQKSLIATGNADNAEPDEPMLVDEEGFTVIPETSGAGKRDSFYSSDEEDEEAKERSKWSRMTIRSTAEASTVATQEEISQQVHNLSSQFQLQDNNSSANRRSRAATMHATPTRDNDSFNAFQRSWTATADAQELVDDPFASPAPAASASRAFTVSAAVATDAFGSDAFTSTPTAARPAPNDNEDDPFAQAALSPVTADSPLRQRSHTLPATLSSMPEPPLEAVGFQQVPPCKDKSLIAAVKGVLRAERIKLWLPPYSSPVGLSTLEDEVVEKVAALVERDAGDTRQALEYLRATTYNKKLGMIRQQEASQQGTAQTE
eukprot:m.150669 g.150669  ORF g.150669 m.150669 type:complete len:469 (-) comp16317_c0_seq1:2135-3541(-)